MVPPENANVCRKTLTPQKSRVKRASLYKYAEALTESSE
jgi:hypothetical protein